jgi:hypothetical protein
MASRALIFPESPTMLSMPHSVSHILMVLEAEKYVCHVDKIVVIVPHTLA